MPYQGRMWCGAGSRRNTKLVKYKSRLRVSLSAFSELDVSLVFMYALPFCIFMWKEGGEAEEASHFWYIYMR